MRWPIRLQLLLPILLVAIVALAMSSATSGYFGSRQVRRQQEDNLRRVIGTLTEATFPLTDRVLHQMRGLSGAEFALLDEKDQIGATTLPTPQSEWELLRSIPAHAELEHLAARPVVSIGGHTYLSHRVPVLRRPYSAERGSLVVLYREDRWREAARQAHIRR